MTFPGREPHGTSKPVAPGSDEAASDRFLRRESFPAAAGTMGAPPSAQSPRSKDDYYSRPTPPKLDLRVPGDWGTRGVLILVLFVILVIVIAGFFVMETFPPHSSPLPLCWPAPVCTATVLAPVGSTFSIYANESYGIVTGLELYGPGAQRNYSWAVTGSFTATHGVSFYVMNLTQDQSWANQGLPTVYDWSSGPPASWGSINATVPPGNNYYFEWINPNPVNCQVTLTAALLAAPT